MTPQEREALIQQYQEGYDEVVKALEGVHPDKLSSTRLPNKWSAREIVHHLADSEALRQYDSAFCWSKIMQ